MDDHRFMRAALREAAQGILRPSPNPAVGAVIVRGGRIVARGFHRRAGLPHAEVEALRALPNARRAAGATLYVTLEPCSTHGRTPPCVSAIIDAGIQRVVIGTIDPNPLHAGRALELLRKAGIEVTSGLLEEECRELNRSYNKWIVTGLPFVVAKAALSLDGRLTRPPGEPRWLTSAASRADAHLLRARADAILIGANTLRIDNPRLTVRGVRGARQPWRVVLAGRRAIPRDLHLFTDRHKDRTLIYTRKPLRSVLRDLGARSVTSVLIEGGMRVLGEAFDEQLVDEVHFYLAPRICGGPISAVGGKGVAASKSAPIIRNVHFQRINGDLRISGVPNYTQEL